MFDKMPLLQESTPKREILTSRDIKMEPRETTLPNPLASVGFPTLPNGAMFTPSQLFLASHLMSNPAAFFHPSLLPMAWQANSPPSPPNSAEQLSPAAISPAALKARKINNNNNIVTSSSTDISIRGMKRKNWKDEELPLSSPTSSASPPSSIDIKEVGRDKQFTCGICNRSFGYKHVLQNHERTHTGEKPFECPECHKRFTRDHHLKTHMRLHTGERPYHCEHCDRQFVQVANLRRHLRVHTGERPYACEHCSAKFSDSNQLKAHILIHTNEKPFSCERCQNRFRRRHHLLHHKCGMATLEKEMTPESDEHDEELRRRRLLSSATSSPIVSIPLQISTLPEQTEPEDLSMSTGHHSSHSSPLSHSSSSRGDAEDTEDSDPHLSTALFLQTRKLQPRS